jgi:uncharacterized protein
MISNALIPLTFLVISNVFMTYAWYGHLKTMKDSPMWIVILASWGIAFFEYCFQVPANRLGIQHFSLTQLKIIQEVITIIVFIAFSTFYMNQAFKWDYLWAGLCMVAAVYFVFR